MNNHPFRNTEKLYGEYEFLQADRLPCPVCGQSTGDCTGDSVKPTHIIGIDINMESMKDEKLVLVEETIYEYRQITPFTKAKVILQKSGSYVTTERAIELGILKIDN